MPVAVSLANTHARTHTHARAPATTDLSTYDISLDHVCCAFIFLVLFVQQTDALLCPV